MMLKFCRPLQLPICTIHKTCLKNNEEAKRHLRATHDISDKEEVTIIMDNLREDEMNQQPLTQSENDLKDQYFNYCPSDNNVLPTIPGLLLTQHDKCLKCSQVISSKRKIPTHMKTCNSTTTIISTQTIFGGNKVCLIVVDATPEKQLNTPTAQWLNHGLSIINKFDEQSLEQPEIAEMDAFVSQMRCPQHLSNFGFSLQQAWCAVHWDMDKQGSHIADFLFKCMVAYVRVAITIYEKNAFVKSHKIMDQYIHVALTSNTIKDYNKHMVSLLYFIYNLKYSGSSHLANNISDHLQTLMDVANDENATNPAQIVNMLHSILYDLFLSTEKKTIQIIPLFIACKTVLNNDPTNDDGFYFGNGADISHLLAAMLHCIQCVVIHDVYGCQDNGHQPITQDPIPAQGCFSLTTVGSGAWKDIIKLWDDGKDFGASYVRHCMNLCNVIRNTEMAHIRFVVCQKHDKCGILDGKELSVSQLAMAARNIQQNLSQLMDDKLLFGFMAHLHNGFWSEAKNLIDKYPDRRNGFWFGNHQSNAQFMDKWKAHFVQHVTTEQTGLLEHDQLRFSKQTAKTYLNHSEQVARKLFWLLHVTGGGPPRATELHLCQYRNGAFASRNIFIQQGRLMYCLLSHKGRDKTQGKSKPIARFPDKKTSDLLLLYLIFVRPLELFISHGITANQAAQIVENDNQRIETGDKFLFSSRGNHLNYKLLTTTFENCFFEQTNVRWNVRDYRQYHAGIVKNFMSAIPDPASNTEENITNHLHEQSGHSIDTAHGTYGVSSLDMKKLDSSQLEVWRRASYRWHVAIGLNETTHDAGTATGTHNVASTVVGPSATVEMDTMALLHNMIKDVQLKMVSVIGKLDKFENGNTGMKRKSSCMEQKRFEIVTNDAILQGLQKCLKNNQAQFRNDHQRQSLTHVSNVDTDTLCILPTGSGKSYLFLIQPLLRTNMVCIVIVPLVALQLDLIEKCRQIGITAYLWENRYSAGGQLVFCSCEHVTKTEYTSFVNEYSKIGKLYAIFFDEAHLVKQWADFRPVFHRLKNHIRPQHCNIPIIALTATCPPVLQSHVIDMLSLRQDGLKIIRQSSVNKNISYNVVCCDEDNLSFYLVQLLAKYLKPDNTSHTGVNVNNPCKLIIYFQTRAECESLFIKVKGVAPIHSRMFMFHAGMSKNDRNKQQQLWSDTSDTKSVHVVFATSAFGCGIDNPFVRTVVHVRLPTSIISFIQESGRAGRDGQFATSVVINVTGRNAGSAVSGSNTSMTEPDVIDRETNDLERWSVANTHHDLYGSLRQWKTPRTAQCRRHIIESYNNSDKPSGSCFDRNLTPCDFCNSNSKRTMLQRPCKSEIAAPNKAKYSSTSMQDAAYSDIVDVDAWVANQDDTNFKNSHEVTKRESSNSNHSKMGHQPNISETNYQTPKKQRKSATVLQFGSAPNLDNAMFDFHSQPAPTPARTLHFGSSPSASQHNRSPSPFPTPTQIPSRSSRSPGSYGSRASSQRIQLQIERTPTQGSQSSPHSSQGNAPSTSQTVTPAMVSEMATQMRSWCAICSSISSTRVMHHNGKDDKQDCKQYRKLCRRCGSKHHSESVCFRTQFRISNGWCWTCSLSSHAGKNMHTKSDFGNSTCLLQNSVRVMTCVFENDTHRHLFNERFPMAAPFTTNTQLVSWLGEVDGKQYTWYADVLNWIYSELLI